MRYLSAFLFLVLGAGMTYIGLEWWNLKQQVENPQVSAKEKQVVEVAAVKNNDVEPYAFDYGLRNLIQVNSIDWDVKVPSGKKALFQLCSFEKGKISPVSSIVGGDARGERRVVGEFIWDENQGALVALYRIGESSINQREIIRTPFLNLDYNPQSFVTGNVGKYGAWQVVGYTYVGNPQGKLFEDLLKEDVKGMVVFVRFIDSTDSNLKRFGDYLSKGITD